MYINDFSTRVEGEGSLDSLIAQIGEAPGAEEDKERRPFVGDTWRVMSRYLGRVNITRADIYLDNVIKTRPPNNDIRHFIKFDRNGTLKWKSEAYDRYVEELRATLARCKANVIVACGNTALYALTGNYGISRWRGSILQTLPEFGSRKLIATYHPAFLSRMYGKKSGQYTYVYRMDWERIAKESKTPDLNYTARELYIDTNYDNVMSYLAACEQAEMIAFDIESTRSSTSKWEMSHFSLALSPTNARTVSLIETVFMDDGAGNKTPSLINVYSAQQELEIMKYFGHILQNKNIRKIGQNLIFDNYFLYRKYGIRVNSWDDTRIGHKIAYPEMPASLAFMASIYTREPYYKDVGKQHGLKDISEQFKIYAAKDAAVTFEIWPRITNSLRLLKNENTYRKRLAAQDMIIYIMERGIKTNRHWIEKLSDGYQKRYNATVKELDSIAEVPHTYINDKGKEVVLSTIRPTAVRDVATYFYGIRGITPYYKRRKSKNEKQVPTVDEDALKRLARKGLAEAVLILKARRLRKFNSTYLKATLANDRLHFQIDPVGVSIGRFSSKRNSFGEGTNSQNLPHNYRRVLVPDRGYMLMEIDASNGENRITANIAPVPSMLQVFAAGHDAHRHTAALIFNKPVDQISKVKGSSSLGDGTQSERDWGKRANHAFNYGFSPEGFSLKYEIPYAQALYIRNGWLRANAGIENYWRWVEYEINKTHMLTNCFGRTMFFMGNTSAELYRLAYSAIPQSTLIDYMIEYGMVTYMKNLDDERWQAFEPINQVHDSIWYQFDMNLGAVELVNVMQQMRRGFETPIPWKTGSFVIPADIKIGSSFKHMYDFNPDKPDAVEKLDELIHRQRKVENVRTY